MAERGGEISFFQGIRARIDLKIDIFLSMRLMTTKFGKQVHLQESSQMRLIRPSAGNVITSRSHEKVKIYLHYHSVYVHQAWQQGNLYLWAPVHKVR